MIREPNHPLTITGHIDGFALVYDHKLIDVFPTLDGADARRAAVKADLDLSDALDRHDRDERVAELLRAAFAYEIANRSYDRLCVFANRCGYEFKTSDETVLQFARRRVDAFQRMTKGA